MSDVKPIFFAVGFIGSLIGAAWLLISLAEGADKSSRSKDALRQTTVAEAENIGLICLQTERYELLATCTRACRNIHSSYEDDTPPEVACMDFVRKAYLDCGTYRQQDYSTLPQCLKVKDLERQGYEEVARIPMEAAQ